MGEAVVSEGSIQRSIVYMSIGSRVMYIIGLRAIDISCTNNLVQVSSLALEKAQLVGT